MNPFTSMAKLVANRANATHSTGPRSEAGKAKVSQNATRHGLARHGLVVTKEDQPEFDQLEAELRAEYQAASASEETAFVHILTHRWNIVRVHKAEQALFADSEGQDPLTHPNTRQRAELYMRYFQRFESSYRAASKHLRQLQTDRAQRMALESEPELLPKHADLPSVQRAAEQTQRMDNSAIEEQILADTAVLRHTERLLKQQEAHEKGLAPAPPRAAKGH
jgi:hypothetical protein